MQESQFFTEEKNEQVQFQYGDFRVAEREIVAEGGELMAKRKGVVSTPVWFCSLSKR